MRSIICIISVSLLGALASPSPSPVQLAKRQSVTPQPASVSLVANVTDPSVSRDSCGSALIDGRAFWTCRDTEPFNSTTGQAELPVYVNSASWTDFNSDGTPAIITNGTVGDASSGTNPILEMYGGDPTSYPVFFPVQSDECPDTGFCTDGTRWAIWPNSPPMVATASDTTTAYTWIPNAHLSGLTALIQEPAYSLYEMTYTSGSSSDVLPTVTLVNEEFWAQSQIGYGAYGNVVVNGTAYLYGQTDSGKATTLASVPADSVTDLSTYQYYVNGSWTSTMPSINDTSAGIANAGTGGQGTFYYAEYFELYLWIGQADISVSADFYLSYAETPEGPWVEPYLIYSGPNGNNPIGSYSLQAHPALLSDPAQNGIYLTYTQQWESTTYGGYVTPLLYVTWE